MSQQVKLLSEFVVAALVPVEGRPPAQTAERFQG